MQISSVGEEFFAVTSHKDPHGEVHYKKIAAAGSLFGIICSAATERPLPPNSNTLNPVQVVPLPYRFPYVVFSHFRTVPLLWHTVQGGPGTFFFYPLVTPAHFHTVPLFHRVPVACFKNTSGVLPLTPTPGNVMAIPRGVLICRARSGVKRS